jgi:hypothetical protein
LPEAIWFESRRQGVLVGLGIVTRFRVGGRDISGRFEQATLLNQSTHSKVTNSTASAFRPWIAPMDHLGLEQAVDRLVKRVVV